MATDRQTQPASSRPIATPRDLELAVLMTVPSHLINEGSIPELETPYNKMPEWADSSLISMGYGDYILSMVKNGGSETINFFFGKNKTKEESAIPYHKLWKKHGNHRWPPILKDLTILTDYSFPRTSNFIQNNNIGVVTAPVYFDRYVYIPDCNEGSRFLLEEFTSPRPFTIPRYRTPVATGVQFNIGGLSGGFQESLHDDIEIPTTRTATMTYVGGVASAAGGGSIEGQFFPRTNFRSWLPYVVYDEQEQNQESGVWYRQRIRVFPPLLPRAIRR